MPLADEPPSIQSVVDGYAKETKFADTERLAALTSRLEALAAHYRDVLSSMPNEFDRFAPFDATLSERVDWLDTEVLNPLKRLIAAVGPENQPWFSLWPHEVVDELKPNFDVARGQLEHLQLMAQNVVINLVVHRKASLPFNEFLRFHIVSDIAAVLGDVLPELQPSRGTYSKLQGEFVGRYPAIIRAAYHAITGEAHSLDRLIKEIVEQRRGE